MEGVIPFPHTDAFWHLWSKRLLVTLWQMQKFLHLPQCFHFLFHYYAFIKRDLPYLCWCICKIMCCRFVVCGKGLNMRKINMLHREQTNTTLIQERKHCGKWDRLFICELFIILQKAFSKVFAEVASNVVYSLPGKRQFHISCPILHKSKIFDRL